MESLELSPQDIFRNTFKATYTAETTVTTLDNNFANITVVDRAIDIMLGKLYDTSTETSRLAALTPESIERLAKKAAENAAKAKATTLEAIIKAVAPAETKSRSNSLVKRFSGSIKLTEPLKEKKDSPTVARSSRRLSSFSFLGNFEKEFLEPSAIALSGLADHVTIDDILNLIAGNEIKKANKTIDFFMVDPEKHKTHEKHKDQQDIIKMNIAIKVANYLNGGTPPSEFSKCQLPQLDIKTKDDLAVRWEVITEGVRKGQLKCNLVKQECSDFTLETQAKHEGIIIEYVPIERRDEKAIFLTNPEVINSDFRKAAIIEKLAKGNNVGLKLLTPNSPIQRRNSNDGLKRTAVRSTDGTYNNEPVKPEIQQKLHRKANRSGEGEGYNNVQLDPKAQEALREEAEKETKPTSGRTSPSFSEAVLRRNSLDKSAEYKKG